MASDSKHRGLALLSNMCRPGPTDRVPSMPLSDARSSLRLDAHNTKYWRYSLHQPGTRPRLHRAVNFRLLSQPPVRSPSPSTLHVTWSLICFCQAARGPALTARYVRPLAPSSRPIRRPCCSAHSSPAACHPSPLYKQLRPLLPVRSHPFSSTPIVALCRC